MENGALVSNSLDPDQAILLSVLIWVQTVCKIYQQMSLVGKELSLNAYIPSFGIVKIGICVMEPLRPSTLPALSYIVAKSVYM